MAGDSLPFSLFSYLKVRGGPGMSFSCAYVRGAGATGMLIGTTCGPQDSGSNLAEECKGWVFRVACTRILMCEMLSKKMVGHLEVGGGCFWNTLLAEAIVVRECKR